MKKILFSIVICLFSLICNAQIKDHIAFKSFRENVIKSQLDFLSSDYVLGRYPGDKGSYLAGEYIASVMAEYGLKPAGDIINQKTGERSYFQHFDVIRTVDNNDHKVSVILSNNYIENEFKLEYLTDFSLNTPSYSRKIYTDLVFVGYGITDPENGYDDFKGVDVKGKIIIRLAGFPGHLDKDSKSFKIFKKVVDKFPQYASWSEKNIAAKKNGAIGVVEMVTTNNVTGWATNVPFRFKNAYGESDRKVLMPHTIERLRFPDGLDYNELINISLRKEVFASILEKNGIEISNLEKEIALNFQPKSRFLIGTKIDIAINVKTDIIKLRNILGVLEGEQDSEHVVVGGHYDHVGYSEGFIWNGSDDNASGTVGVLAMANAFRSLIEKPKRSIVFAAWDAEEKGFLGSKYYVANPYYPIDKCRFYTNLDMISRDHPDDKESINLDLVYGDSNNIIYEMLDSYNKEYNFNFIIDLKHQKFGSGGSSDYVPFSIRNIPYIGWMSGLHKDYHTPYDESQRANIVKMTNILKFSFLTINKKANE